MLNHDPARSWSDADEQFLRDAMLPKSKLPRITIDSDDLEETLDAMAKLRKCVETERASKECWRLAAIVGGACAVVMVACFLWAIEWALKRG